MTLFLLYESAAGYSLFEVAAFDEISTKLKTIQKKILDFSYFSNQCHLKAFQPFVSAEEALANALGVQKGTVTEELQSFLSTNLPINKKKLQVVLACQDKQLGQELIEKLGVQLQYNEVIQEIFRGIRFHLIDFLKQQNFKESDLIRAQLGLAHSFSRNKVALDINRQDKHITQAIAIIEQLDKDLNTLSMRLKEWYSWHFPELARIVSDNLLFTKCVDLFGNRLNLTQEHVPLIEEIVVDGDIAQKIYEAAKISMGQDLNELDAATIAELCKRILQQFEFRHSMSEYLKDKMNIVAPNLTSLIGENVGAKLISHSGSLTNLSKCPASTIQILGAEKALFRALKTKGNTPKYGLLYHSSFIGRASGKDKGKISRYLANKCAIAARLDQFLIKPCNAFGERLKVQVEERLRYFAEGGDVPNNEEVMDEVLTELRAENLYFDSEKTKLKKKKKSKTTEAVEVPGVSKKIKK